MNSSIFRVNLENSIPFSNESDCKYFWYKEPLVVRHLKLNCLTVL